MVIATLCSWVRNRRPAFSFSSRVAATLMGLLLFAAFGLNYPAISAPLGPKDTPFQWVNPPSTTFPGVHHATFRSRAMQCEVGYNVYLPPGYETSGRRYPVVYFLHGAGASGNENRRTHVVGPLDAAIRAGTLPPMIVVFPNGTPFSFWADSADGRVLVETSVIRELIPHVDQTYRTVASRDGRAVAGVSMGGCGAVRYGLQYPELFSAAVGYGAALFDGETMASHDSEFFRRMFGRDPAAYAKYDPFAVARVNADSARGRVAVRLVAGERDFSRPEGEKMHALLGELKLPHEYVVLPGVGHDLDKYLRNEQDALRGFAFIARHIGAGAE